MIVRKNLMDNFVFNVFAGFVVVGRKLIDEIVITDANSKIIGGKKT